MVKWNRIPAMLPETLAQLEQQISYSFRDKQLVCDAFTHSSTGADTNYERLEFLGDRVLGLVVSDLLYKNFPDEREGDLAKRLAALVQGEFLAKVACEINLGSYVIFSDSEAHAGGAENANILADVFEALIGAMYLDSDFETCATFISKIWMKRLDVLKAPPQHPKTTLQEWAQEKGLPLPVYKILSQSGPDHAPVFEVQVSVKGYENLSAQGRSRQAAEKQVANDFIEKFCGEPDQ